MFERGLCICGVELWSTFKGQNFKYKTAFLVKATEYSDTAKPQHTLVWQWFCKTCGRVHHEECAIVRHSL